MGMLQKLDIDRGGTVERKKHPKSEEEKMEVSTYSHFSDHDKIMLSVQSQRSAGLLYIFQSIVIYAH